MSCVGPIRRWVAAPTMGARDVLSYRLALFTCMDKLPPIIPSIWTIAQREAAMVSPHSLVHVAGGKLGTIETFIQPLKRAGKNLWVHVDMIAGLKMDVEGLSVIEKLVNPQAIVTSNLSLAGMARKMNKPVVLRVFLHDTQSLQSSLSAIYRIRPNVVCCMPAIVFPYVRQELSTLGIPILVAGLVRSEVLRDELLNQGVSVEIGDFRLW